MDVKLTHPHTHAGRDYAPGDVLSLPGDAAAWLINLGRAVAVPAPALSVAAAPVKQKGSK